MLSVESLRQDNRCDINMSACDCGIDIFVENRSFIKNLFDLKVKITEESINLYIPEDLEWFIAKFMEYCSSKDYYMALEAFMLTSHLYKSSPERGKDFVRIYNECRIDRSKSNIRYLMSVIDRTHMKRIFKWFARCERFELDYSKPSSWTYNNTL